MGMFDLDEDLIPLIQSHRGSKNISNSNIIYPSVFFFISFYDHNFAGSI